MVERVETRYTGLQRLYYLIQPALHLYELEPTQLYHFQRISTEPPRFNQTFLAYFSLTGESVYNLERALKQ